MICAAELPSGFLEIDHLDGVLFIDRVQQLEDLSWVSVGENGQQVGVPLSLTTYQGGGRF